MAEVLKNDGSLPATKTGANDIRSAVETANAEDENRKQDGDDDSDDDDGDHASSQATGDDTGDDDSQGDDTTDGDDADGDDDDGDDDSKPGDDTKQRRFTQFAGDGSDEAYLSNLEKGYLNTSKEAVRLNSELEDSQAKIDAITRAAAADPELASKLSSVLQGQGGAQGAGGSGSDRDSSADADADNPFVRNLQAEWQEKSEKEIDDFIEANPEVVTDPKIKGDVQYWMKQFSNAHFNRTGRLMSGGEAMAAAYKHLGLDNKLEKQNLADGAKKNAAPARQRNKAKKSSGGQKPRFTDAQIAMAKSMGRDEAWLQKNAR